MKLKDVLLEAGPKGPKEPPNNVTPMSQYRGMTKLDWFNRIKQGDLHIDPSGLKMIVDLAVKATRTPEENKELSFLILVLLAQQDGAEQYFK